MSDEKLINQKELCKMLGVTKQSIYVWETNGKFPVRRKLGAGGRVAWLNSEVQEWMKNLPKSKA